MKKLLLVSMLVTVCTSLWAQQGNCGDCGFCYVIGKVCKPPGTACGPRPCELCADVVRTEFCGNYIAPYTCWCFGLNSEACASKGGEHETNRSAVSHADDLYGWGHSFAKRLRRSVGSIFQVRSGPRLRAGTQVLHMGLSE